MEPVLAAALALGKPVVTANKALLASKLADLGVLAQRTATPLYCEAAAAAALPIIRHLSHRADEIDSLLGIVNGTCNFVMTRLEAELSMTQAIAEAQALGFADADPTDDLNGMDAAAKLSILAYRAFGAWVRPDSFPVRGITALTPADCDLAESMGCRIRLIARAARVGSTASRKVRSTAGPHGALDMAVEPLLVPTWHLLASVEEEYNAIYLRCASSGDLSFFGKGGGAMPAAAAVLGDLIDLAQDNSSRWPVPQALTLVRPGSDVEPPPRRHYLRTSGEGHPGLERRIETLVRRAGLTVQNRASRTERDLVHLAFIVSVGSAAQIADVESAVARLARVQQCLCLGVLE
jgi:homoserine dehydrogenase